MPLSGHAGQFRTSLARAHTGTRLSGLAARMGRRLICVAKMKTNKPRFILGAKRVGRAQGCERNLQLGCAALQWKSRLLSVMPWSKAGSE